MMSKKYVIVMALLGIFLISAMVMPTTTNTYASVVANPYCDKVSDEYMESGGTCHDRKDYYDGGPNNGLYPCNDGSNRVDWRDCPDVSGFDYSNDNDNDSSGSDDEREMANEENDKDNDNKPDDWDAPREGESVQTGTPTKGYIDEEGTIEEEEGAGEDGLFTN
jgi:hypothetical protein